MFWMFSIANSLTSEDNIFSDTCNDAIAAEACVKVFSETDRHDVGFLLEKGKVDPTHGHTIPRLELCAAVMAIDLVDTISEQLDFAKILFTSTKIVA